MNRFLWGGTLLAVLSCMSSCSLQRLISGKKAATHNQTVTDTLKPAMPVAHHFVPLPEQDTLSMLPDTTGMMRRLIDMMIPVCANAKCRYTSFSGKAKVHFESPEDKQDFTANIRVKKDSAIWIDITALGGMFHAARVFITPDSFFMINYQQKEASKISLKQVAKILPTEVDFMSLQNLIVGDPLRNGIITQVAILGGSWMTTIEDSSYRQNINYSKSDSTISLNQVKTLDPKGPEAVLKFENYEMIGGNKMSKTRAVNIQNGNDRFLLEMELQNIEFDKQLEMPFSVPNKYTIKSN